MGSNAGDVNTSGLFATAGDAAAGVHASGGQDPAHGGGGGAGQAFWAGVGNTGSALQEAGKSASNAEVPGGGPMPGINPGASDIWSDPQFMREVFMMLIPQTKPSRGR